MAANIIFKLVMAYVTAGILSAGPIMMTYSLSMPTEDTDDSKKLHKNLLIAGIIMTIFVPLVYFAFNFVSSKVSAYQQFY